MAYNQRGRRGQSRGRGGAGFAQSGGKNSTFGGGKGGGAYGAESTKGQRKGKGRLGNNTGYNIRESGGDATLVPKVFKAAKATGVAHGQGASKARSRTYHKPVRGGH